MKRTSLIKKLGSSLIIILLLTLSFGTEAQSRRNADCTQISNLSEQQNDQLSELKAKHFKVMDDLRAKRRACATAEEKAQVRNEMQAEVNRHKKAVNEILTPEQRAQYAQSTPRGGCAYNRSGRRGGNDNCNVNTNSCRRGKGRMGKGACRSNNRRNL